MAGIGAMSAPDSTDRSSRREIVGGMLALPPFLASCRESLADHMPIATRPIDRVDSPDWENSADAQATFLPIATHINNEGVAVSSGGRAIIYARVGAPSNEIEFIDVAARTIRCVYHPNRLLKIVEPTFSPNGERVMATICPPMYSGISNLIEIGLTDLVVGRVYTDHDIYYHSARYFDGGVVCGAKRGPDETPDGRKILNPAYRDGFFSDLVRINGKEVRELTTSALLADLRGLSPISDDRVLFQTSGWVERENGHPRFRSIASRYPEWERLNLPLLFTVNKQGDPELAVDPARLATFVQKHPSDGRATVQYLGALRDGAIFYASRWRDFSARVMIDDGRQVVEGASVSIGPNANLAVADDGTVALVNGDDELPAIAIAERSGRTTEIRRGSLTRLPPQRISYAYVSPDGL